MLPKINSHLFQGTSVRVIAQFAQHYNTGKSLEAGKTKTKRLICWAFAGREVFQHYDYGRRANLERYGTPEPWVYDLRKVTAPVYLYYGLNDLISTPEVRVTAWPMTFTLAHFRLALSFSLARALKSDFPRVTPQDSEWAASQLGNVHGLYQVDDDLFNHWDFLWSINANELLNDHILPLYD